jgi:aryl-alcohol dehydrogenase-like predicted oxidoreductase
MQTRALANLTVTRMGIGLAALGRPGYINLDHGDDLPGRSVEGMERHAHAVLDAAYAAGIRYFDAARSYGRAEEFLGNWLRSRQITDVTVGSKWGYTYTAGWQVNPDGPHEVKEHSLAVLCRQWAETQQHLGGYLNLYQVHSATLDSGILDNHDVLDELARLKNDGTAIGLTVSGPAQADTLQQAVEIERDGVRLFDTVQITWNLLESSTGDILRQVHGEGMGVIVKEALANGRLTPRSRDSAPLRAIAERHSTTVDAVALAAVLAQPWADVVLSGAATVDHVRSNVQALDVIEDVAVDMAEAPETYWQKRSNLAWN